MNYVTGTLLCNDVTICWADGELARASSERTDMIAVYKLQKSWTWNWLLTSHRKTTTTRGFVDDKQRWFEPSELVTHLNREKNRGGKLRTQSSSCEQSKSRFLVASSSCKRFLSFMPCTKTSTDRSPRRIFGCIINVLDVSGECNVSIYSDTHTTAEQYYVSVDMGCIHYIHWSNG